MVLHELATNAAKYGALAEFTGRVSLNWQCQRNRLDLQWLEAGGPPVKPPTITGYGTKVIAASIIQQLDGTATFDWQPDGLRFTMSIAIGDGATIPQRTARTAVKTGEVKINGSGAAVKGRAGKYYSSKMRRLWA
jgi:hypothetical protein